MKRIFTSALALLLITGAAQAQQTKEEKGKHKDQREMVAQKLNLTEEQKAKLKDIHQRERAEMEALRKDASVSPADKQTRRKAIQEKYKTEMRAVLTPEQAKQMDAMKQSHAGKEGEEMGEKHHGKHDGKERREDMKEAAKELNLTADQQAKMKAINEEMRTRREAIRTNTSLTQEQKKEQMKSLAKEHQEKVKAVLTAEQQDKAKELKKDWKKDKKGRKTVK